MASNKEYKRLVAWIKENGGTLSNIGIVTNPKNNERSAIASKGIRNNTTIVKIPKSIIIHDGLGQISYFGKQLLRGNHSGISNLKIALVVIFMLDDMRKDSIFLPYYRILPREIKNFPIFWNERVLSILQGSSMLKKIEQRKINFYKDYKVICRCCPTFSNEYSFNDFLFIRILVGSRNFGIRIDGIKRVAMIPAGDMLNHDVSPNTHWYYDNNKDCFIMKSNRGIPNRYEITDTYGNKCNSQMLLYYGFALPNNIYNTLTIEYKNDDNRTRSERRKYELQSEIRGELRRNITDQFTKNLFTFLRILAANDTELSDNKYKLDYTAPVSLKNELNMLYLLSDYMERLENTYIFKYHKIGHIIKTVDKNSPEYLALLVIYGELQIINFYKEFSRELVIALKNTTPPTKRDFLGYYITVKQKCY